MTEQVLNAMPDPDAVRTVLRAWAAAELRAHLRAHGFNPGAIESIVAGAMAPGGTHALKVERLARAALQEMW